MTKKQPHWANPKGLPLYTIQRHSKQNPLKVPYNKEWPKKFLEQIKEEYFEAFVSIRGNENPVTPEEAEVLTFEESGKHILTNTPWF